jgi:hypothetical protein
MQQFLGMWLALCLVGAYLGLVALCCGGCIRLMRWVDAQRRNGV